MEGGDIDDRWTRKGQKWRLLEYREYASNMEYRRRHRVVNLRFPPGVMSVDAETALISHVISLAHTSLRGRRRSRKTITCKFPFPFSVLLCGPSFVVSMSMSMSVPN
jgi:hypothetical protein